MKEHCIIRHSQSIQIYVCTTTWYGRILLLRAFARNPTSNLINSKWQTIVLSRVMYCFIKNDVSNNILLSAAVTSRAFINRKYSTRAGVDSARKINETTRRIKFFFRKRRFFPSVTPVRSSVWQYFLFFDMVTFSSAPRRERVQTMSNLYDRLRDGLGTQIAFFRCRNKKRFCNN